jgi:hypothetical protein
MRASVCALAVALAMCARSPARAQGQSGDLPLVEWSESRKLAIKDFKGKIPSRANEASLSWVAIEASWECQDGKGSSRSRAVFDPNRSWWREVIPNLWRNIDEVSPLAPRDDGGRALLAHEQLHFDMTEVWSRRIREKFETLPMVCRTTGAIRGFEKNIAEMEREWQEEQHRYDRETGHGTDGVRQRAWVQKTARALQETYPAAAR